MTYRILAIVVFLSAVVQAQVSYERLLRAGAEPHNWLTYSGTYSGHRYSALDQITPQNVRDLELKWVFQARSLEKFEATPLVIDSVMYTVQPPNDIVAIDAATGRVFWVYRISRRRWRGCAAAASTAGWRFSTTRSSWERSTATSSPSMRGAVVLSGMSRWRVPRLATA